MNPFLPFLIAGLIACAAVWIAAYWPARPMDTTDEVMCPLPEPETLALHASIWGAE